MIKFWKNLFTVPSAKVLAQRSLEDSRRQLLTHQANATYHAKLAECHQENIRRLTRMVEESHG